MTAAQPGQRDELDDYVAATRETDPDFRAAYDATAARLPIVLGDGPTITFHPEVILAALRECVAVLQPGDTLAVRLPLDIDPDEIEDLAEQASQFRERWGVGLVFVAGEEFAVITA